MVHWVPISHRGLGWTGTRGWGEPEHSELKSWEQVPRPAAEEICKRLWVRGMFDDAGTLHVVLVHGRDDQRSQGRRVRAYLDRGASGLEGAKAWRF